MGDKMNLSLLQKPQSIYGVLQLGLFALFVLSLVSALHPVLRTQLRSVLASDYRTIVSAVDGDLDGSGHSFKVLKVKTRDHLFLEIYDTIAAGSGHLVERIQLADNRDGYFNFNGHTTNLAIEDVDGSGNASIVAPSFDADLVGHLHIYTFNSHTQSFAHILR
jgi:hypothetical protein